MDGYIAALIVWRMFIREPEARMVAQTNFSSIPTIHWFRTHAEYV